MASNDKSDISNAENGERLELFEPGRTVGEESHSKRTSCWREMFWNRSGICVAVLIAVVFIGMMFFMFYQASMNRRFQRYIRWHDKTRMERDISNSRIRERCAKCIFLLNAMMLYIQAIASCEKGLADIPKILDRYSTETSVSHKIRGIRQDYLIQECQGSELKQSFPDMDDSMVGYNILRGYPLAIGHDPGFTIPIFTADYTEGKHSADCRYSIPQGVFLAPDVSCVLSFSSKITQTHYEFASSLSRSAHVSGGGWGASFSASIGFKESSSQIASAEYVFILSSASCTNYFSKLIKKTPPPLHPVFIKWIDLLAQTDDKDTYMAFFDTFGTHFPTMVTYGARYTYQYKMSSSAYETAREKGTNIAVDASYSGLFSVGGGFSMDSSQRESASSFSKSVETKTITVGASPPSNGDATAWASEVKTSPVPVRYDLESIENLFTDDYMEVQSLNTSRIVENIIKYKYGYCEMLKQKGEINSCEDVKPGLELPNTRLYYHFSKLKYTLTQCIDHCLQNVNCSAITYCVTCTPKDTDYFEICYMHSEQQRKENVVGNDEEGFVVYIFPAKIKTVLKITLSKIIGTPRSMENPADDKADYNRCLEICNKDINCNAFSYCQDCRDRTVYCEIYASQNIDGLLGDSTTTSFFVSARAYTEFNKID